MYLENTHKVCQHLIIKSEVKMKNQLIKGLITGFIVGCFFSACDSNLLQAEDDDLINCDDLSYGDYGTVEWNPIYVKIVE